MSDRDTLAVLIGKARSEYLFSSDIADDLIGQGWRPPARVITTAAELADLSSVPVGTVVRSDAGTIACRFDQNSGVLLGDDRVFRWADLGRPVRILFDPTEEAERRG